MTRLACVVLLPLLAVSFGGAQTSKTRRPANSTKPTATPATRVDAGSGVPGTRDSRVLGWNLPDLDRLGQMAARFAPTWLRVDLGGLSSGDRQAVVKLVEAARLLDGIYMDQSWAGSRNLYRELQKDTSPLGRARAKYFWINKGPWDELNDFAAFVPQAPARKLPGANFYPEDMSKAEFERWLATLPEAEKKQATGFFTVIRRGPDRKLTAVPYSEAYKADLAHCAQLLHDAAAVADDPGLKRFLTLRADAFLSNDYYESDMAWMELDSPVEVTIGPYETYNDELFGYKAAFEGYVSLRDDRETAKLAAFSRHLQQIEDNLPEAPEYRNPRLGAAAPIAVVNQILSSGDGAHGVQTAAYNLPNDERVVRQKGSKRIMLKNVQEAKFRTVQLPIALRLLSREAQPDVSFEMFFTHILAHELVHGLGPHQITVNGRDTSVRQELKDTYSAIEEAKADITGMFALLYMMDHAKELQLGELLPGDEAAQRQLCVTYLASAFRSLRFGLNDAHGKGMAVQFNYLSDRGAFVQDADGGFNINFLKMKTAVRDLTRDLLTLEATGDYTGARRLLNTLGVIRPNVQQALRRLQNTPTDIEPIPVTADELTGNTSPDPFLAPPANSATASQAKSPAKRKTTARSRRRTRTSSGR